jgi:glycosyltransferase involved in cell wall biosynthesis
VKNPRRIACFFSTSGHSGVDRAMQNLIPSLAERGYEIDLLHIKKHGPYLQNTPERVKVIELGTRSTYPSLFPLIHYLRRERPAVLLADKDRVNRTALLARYLSRTNPYLVLSSGTTISIDLASRGVFERWLQRTSMGKLYAFADQVIVTSTGVADDMATYTGLKRNRIRVVPSPVVPDASFDCVYSRPEHPWFQVNQPPVILGVGELGMRKDFATLIRAFSRVRQQRACRLVILGKGKQRDELASLAASLGVAADVELLGFKSNPYDYMAYSALFAFTSLWEGLGFVIIESLAVGTPVVSVDCPSGPSEILQGGKYGRLVPVGDDLAMSQAILETLNKPLPRDLLQEAARPYSVSAATTAYLGAFGLPANYAD